jgi:hypothetical protein
MELNSFLCWDNPTVDPKI